MRIAEKKHISKVLALVRTTRTGHAPSQENCLRRFVTHLNADYSETIYCSNRYYDQARQTLRPKTAEFGL